MCCGAETETFFVKPAGESIVKMIWWLIFHKGSKLNKCGWTPIPGFDVTGDHFQLI